MPNVLPTIPQEPAQGIQALLDTVYLWNPDVANNLIEQVNELLEELGELSNISGAIKPYSQLEAPVRQYMPMSYNDGVYVANEEMTTLPATPDLTKWTLIATKVDEQALEQQISRAVSGEADLRQQADNTLQGNIDAEERARIAADQGLQTQIDAISAASDVKDIVGTYQELENYDTSTLGNNDIIKVLQDETQEDATTYYRWVAAEDEFQLIGEEGPYYTRAQTDAMLEEKQDIMQFSTMPESAEYQNRIIEYTGETKEDAPASATAEQTAGSGLSNVDVNLETFEEKENPVGSETVSFVCTSRTSPELDVTPNTTRLTVVSADADGFEDAIIGLFGFWVPSFANGSMIYDGGFDQWTLYAGDRNYTFPSGTGPEVIGVVISGEPMSTDGFTYVYTDEYPVWEKDDEEVDLAEYGVTYNGNPDISDEITISYTPEVVGRTKGYFYASAPVLEPAQATIAQTAGAHGTTIETSIAYTWQGEPTNPPVNYVIDAQALYDAMDSYGWSGYIETAGFSPETSINSYFQYNPDVDGGTVGTPNGGWLYGYTDSIISFPDGAPNETFRFYTRNFQYAHELTNLSVNVDAFVAAEHPTGDTTVDFVATVYNDFQLSPTSFEVEGGTLTVDHDTFLQAYRNSYGDPDNVYLFEVEVQSGNFYMMVYYTNGSFDTWIDPVEFGFSYTGDLSELTTTTICNINCTEPGAYWYKNGSLVDIAEYGISYDEEPEDGDTITVTYTAPFISGYAWEQIDVQPGGGAGGGIEWKTIVDIPTNYTGNNRPAPEYTIAGGLPNGDYEFYFQVLCRISSQVPTGVATYKVQIRVNNDSSVIYGRMGYVIDGQWLPGDEYMVQDIGIWGLFWNSDGDLKIYRNSTPWATNFTRNQARDGVPGCFKLSAIKDMKTGEEYIATGVLNSTGGISSGWQYGGEVYARALQQQPYIPVYQEINFGNLNESIQYIMLSPGLEKDGRSSSAREIDASLKAMPPHTGTFHIIIENSAYSSTVRVLEATGVFEDMEIGDNNGETLLYLPTIPQGEEITYTVFLGAKGSSQGATAYSRWNSEINNFVPFGISTVGYPVLANTLGAIDQYKGVTNASYTNGYFYKATGTLVHTPSSITFTTNHPDFGITVADGDALVQWFVDNAGWSKTDTEQLLIDNTYWSFNYDTDSGEVTWVYWNAFGEDTDPNLCSLFTVTYTGGSTGVFEFQADSAFTPSEDEVQNGHWERIDVQPAGATYTAGNGISIDSNNEISVADPVLVNKAGTFAQNSIAIGATTGTSAARTNSVQIGYNSFASGTSSTNVVCVGADTRSSSYYGIAIGSGAQVGSNAAHATQIGSTGSTTTNSDANTFKVGNANGNYEIMSADGTIPADRLTHAINKYASMPTAASTNEGWIVQYTGTTDATYTHGYIYECVGTTAQGSATATQTTGSSLADLAVNVATFETQVTTTGSYVFVFDGMDWHLDTITGEIVDVILDYGITFTGTPASGDAITVDYTAGGTTYAWTQTSVQPTSGGLPSQTGNAGKFLITDGTNASWGYAVTQILIPDTTSNTRWNIGRFGFGGELVITQPHFGSSARLDLYLAYNAVYSAKQGGATLGTSAYSWNNVFTQKINNGADIAVPTTGGTMVVADYTSAQQGDVLTLDANGDAVWAAGASGTSSITVTLAAANWSGSSQTVTATGVTASNTVIVGAAPASASEYNTSGVICTAQGADSLTFSCSTTPSNDLTVTVLIM